jgi:hypothetical protein
MVSVPMFWFRGAAAATTLADETDPPRLTPPSCPRCRAVLIGSPRYARFRVCDECDFHDRRSARQTITHLTDLGSFREMDAQLGSTDPLAFTDDQPYRDRLGEQQRRTGEIDAIVTGTATLAGHPSPSPCSTSRSWAARWAWWWARSLSASATAPGATAGRS